MTSLAKLTAPLLFPLMFCAPGGAANWADRGEYDLVLTIRAEALPQKRLALLEKWKASYPRSEFRHVRQEMFFAIHQAAGSVPGMLEVVREMLADRPDDFQGLYWCSLLVPTLKETPPDLLALGEKAARRLLDARPPAALPAAEWNTRKPAVQRVARRALSWLLWRKGDFAGAAGELTARLKENPKDAEASAWFGTMLALQKEPARHVEALWHLARASSLAGGEGLSDAQRRQVGTLFERLYASYHGATDGLEEIRAQAGAAPLPPSGFTVESAAAVAARKQEEELSRSNPQLAAWLRIRRQLDGPEGEKYFNETLRSAVLPKLRGVVVRHSPEDRPTEIVLSLSVGVPPPAAPGADPPAPAEAGAPPGAPPAEEVTLKLNSPLPNPAPAGTVVEFEGIPEAFVRSPFNLTVTLDTAKLEGWPARPGSRRARQGK